MRDIASGRQPAPTASTAPAALTAPTTPRTRPPRPAPRAVRRAAVLLALPASALLASCTVGFWNYQRIEAPEADHLQARCQGKSGPPELTYYPFHGIFISLALDPLQLGLHVPRGMTAALDGNSLLISGPDGSGRTLSVRLKAARHQVMADDDPAAFSVAPDPYTAPDGFGSLQGGSRDGFAVWYLFDEDVGARAPDAPDPAEFLDHLKSGTLQLPAITLNGRTWPAQVLPFTRTSYQEATQLMLTPGHC
jgi:hypothetical protein